MPRSRSATGSRGGTCPAATPRSATSTRSARSGREPEIAARLALVVGPAEEIFWRGLVQTALMRRFGRWPGAALAATAYGGVHVTTGNFTLFGAAGIAGAHWCALYAAGLPLGALVVSHVAWDIWIFLVQPTGETEAIGPDGRVVRLELVPAA